MSGLDGMYRMRAGLLAKATAQQWIPGEGLAHSRVRLSPDGQEAYFTTLDPETNAANGERALNAHDIVMTLGDGSAWVVSAHDLNETWEKVS